MIDRFLANTFLVAAMAEEICAFCNQPIGTCHACSEPFNSGVEIAEMTCADRVHRHRHCTD